MSGPRGVWGVFGVVPGEWGFLLAVLGRRGGSCEWSWVVGGGPRGEGRTLGGGQE